MDIQQPTSSDDFSTGSIKKAANLTGQASETHYSHSSIGACAYPSDQEDFFQQVSFMILTGPSLII